MIRMKLKLLGIEYNAEDSLGYLKIWKFFVEWRVTGITIVTANVPAYTEVTFTKKFAKAPAVLASNGGTVPGVTVTGVSAANVTTTGCRIYATRNNTTNTSVYWLAIGIVE